MKKRLISTRFLFVLFTTISLSGCLSATNVKPTEDHKDIVDFSISVVKDMSHKLGKLVAPLSNKLENHDTYVIFHATVFPVNGGISGILTSYNDFCNYSGGFYQHNACKLEQKTDKVLFWAKVTRLPKLDGRSSTPKVGIEVIHPTKSIKNKKYLSALIDHGYEMSEKRSLRKINEQMLNEKQVRAHKLKMQISKELKQQMPLVRKIGSRICQIRTHRMRDVKYIGYVEQVTNDKIQIRISRAHFVSIPNMRPGGFEPSIIWDSPWNWVVCNI